MPGLFEAALFPRYLLLVACTRNGCCCCCIIPNSGGNWVGSYADKNVFLPMKDVSFFGPLSVDDARTK